MAMDIRDFTFDFEDESPIDAYLYSEELLSLFIILKSSPDSLNCYVGVDFWGFSRFKKSITFQTLPQHLKLYIEPLYHFERSFKIIRSEDKVTFISNLDGCSSDKGDFLGQIYF